MWKEKGFVSETFNGTTILDSALRLVASLAVASLCKNIETILNVEEFVIPLKHVDIVGHVSDIVTLEGARQAFNLWRRIHELRTQKTS